MTNEHKGSPMPRWARAKVVEVFGADLRSLAALRIVLAILVLADLASRVPDLYAHYTDWGVVPRSVLRQEVLDRWAFSLNLANGEVFFQVLLFGVTALAALALLVGYRTRLATVVVWVLVLSIQWRNPMVNNAGADLLRMLLFWGMFLPLGAYWSVDRARKSTPAGTSMRFLSLATFALFMQIAFMYWFTAAFKSGVVAGYESAREWRVDGTAIYYALGADQFATPIGSYLLNFPELLKVLTFATFYFEVFGPFVLFFPFFIGPVRTGAVLAFMGLHFGIWLTMDIGLFPWVSALCMVCFLPSWFWDRALPKLRAALPKQPNLVRRLQRPVARLISAYWLPLRSRLSAKAGVVERPLVAGQQGARVGDDERLGSQPRQQDAAAGPTPGAIFAARLRASRLSGRSHGKPPAPSPPRTSAAEPAMLRSSVVTNLLALFFLLYVLCWNLASISIFTMPERVVPLGRFFGLSQTWNMYATPYNDGWYVIPGTLRSGEQVDLMEAAVTRGDFRPRGVSWEKPQDIRSTFKNEHWRKYLTDIRSSEDRVVLHQYLGNYICRGWNAHHAGDEQLMTFQISFMSEETALPGYQPAAPEEIGQWEQDCFFS